MRRLLFTVILSLSALLSAQEVSAQDTNFASQVFVRSGDVLQVRVWPDSTLGGEFTIEDSGFVYLPILGQLTATGVPLDQLRATIREGYSTALRSPIVTVTPLFKVSVLGAVNRPGLYVLQPPQTVWDAISLAGGFRDDAKEDDISIIRGDTVYSLDAERAITTGESALAVPLGSGDRIMVPRGWGFNLTDILVVLQTVLVTVTLLNQN